MIIDYWALGCLLIAYLLALPVGWERERHERSAGLRTFPLVAVTAAGFVLVSMRVTPDANAHSRVIQGLMTGIGFIGAGVIMQGKSRIHGTATASSILVTACIGVAVACRAFDIAVVLSAMSLLTLRIFQAWKRPPDGTE